MLPDRFILSIYENNGMRIYDLGFICFIRSWVRIFKRFSLPTRIAQTYQCCLIDLVGVTFDV